MLTTKQVAAFDPKNSTVAELKKFIASIDASPNKYWVSMKKDELIDAAFVFVRYAMDRIAYEKADAERAKKEQLERDKVDPQWLAIREGIARGLNELIAKENHKVEEFKSDVEKSGVCYAMRWKGEGAMEAELRSRMFNDFLPLFTGDIEITRKVVSEYISDESRRALKRVLEGTEFEPSSTSAMWNMQSIAEFKVSQARARLLQALDDSIRPTDKEDAKAKEDAYLNVCAIGWR